MSPLDAQPKDKRPAPEATDHPYTTKNAETGTQEQNSSQHRPELLPWKWRGSLFAVLLTCLIHGMFRRLSPS
jgi:hypothetical protein